MTDDETTSTAGETTSTAGETTTDDNARLHAYPEAYETRLVEQFPALGPSLVVAWFSDGSLVIEIGTDGGSHEYGLTDLTTEMGKPGGIEITTILRLEPVQG